MECFISEQDDKILLVGEGNFSFSIDFVNYVEKVFPKYFAHNDRYKIISTCFESAGKISSSTSVNVDFLREKVLKREANNVAWCVLGIEVEFGIDATSLEHSAPIKDYLFSRIVFNFPHVGGKMRIERNRKLLRDFLVSARRVLQENGTISVALCAGQGGSHLEGFGSKQHRRWDDSWKAVENAAEADLLLTSVLPLPPTTSLPLYCSTGYRGLAKSFCLKDAKVHTFRPSQTPIPLPLSTLEINTLLQTVPINNTALHCVHANKVIRNPWNKSTSLQSIFLDWLTKECALECEVDGAIAVSGVGCSEEDYECLSSESGCGKVLILRSLLLNELSNNFAIAPVECTIKLLSSNAKQIAFEMLMRKSNQSEDTVGDYFFVSEDQKIVTIFVDRYLSCIRSEDWRMLWVDSNVFSVSPRCYPLDITLSAHSILSEQKFSQVLWSLAGDFITKIERLSEFAFEGTSKVNYCYRIIYRSYEIPLFKARVVKIHNEVIAKALEEVLDVRVV